MVSRSRSSPARTTALSDAFRDWLRLGLPTLFVSSADDVRTPVSNALEIESGFSSSRHGVAEHASHDSRELMSPAYRRLFQAFLRGENCGTCGSPCLRCHSLPKPNRMTTGRSPADSEVRAPFTRTF